MVVDTSAMVAIFNQEADAEEFEARLIAASAVRMSAATYVELSIIVARGVVPDDLVKLDHYLEKAGIEIIPVTRADAVLAREAFVRYGKGRHPAKFNFGDCFSYALSNRLGEPLLFKGNDFSQTDIERA